MSLGIPSNLVSLQSVGGQQLTNISIGAKVDSMLPENDKELTGRVHSVFRKAINIAFPDSSLVSVVDSTIGQGPFNIVINLPSGLALDRFDIKAGQVAKLSKESLSIGNLDIDLKSSHIYESKHNLSYGLLNQKSQIEQNVLRMAGVVNSEGHFQGLAPMLNLQEHGTPNIFSVELISAVDSFLIAAQSHNLEAIKISASRLIGLGPGLTPAADDFLSGFMLASFLFTENLGGNLDSVTGMSKVIAEFSNQTTILSAQYLRQAAIGNGTERAVSVIEKLLTSNLQDDVERVTRSLLSIGATSGTDFAIGIIFGNTEGAN
jgi:hypothetical protein